METDSVTGCHTLAQPTMSSFLILLMAKTRQTVEKDYTKNKANNFSIVREKFRRSLSIQHENLSGRPFLFEAKRGVDKSHCSTRKLSKTPPYGGITLCLVSLVRMNDREPYFVPYLYMIIILNTYISINATAYYVCT